MKRTHTCGELNAKDIGKAATLCGWVDSCRDHGGLIFVDLRDRFGITQVVFNPEDSSSLHQAAGTLGNEYVIAVNGRVSHRPKGTENRKLPTGEIELRAEGLKTLNSSQALPFPLEDGLEVSEEVRFNYRYLDLRRRSRREIIEFRHKLLKTIRDFLDKEQFLEIETPVLTKSTPEGARDYLVPSRLYPGKFFALPQSPQLFKQILMVAGFERYFQIVRCFRDEDLRSDRQPEFTQLDLEMSFVEEEDIFRITERLLEYIGKKVLARKIKRPFPRLTYREAMRKFGTDKPDLRFSLAIVDVTGELKDTGFKIFQKEISSGGKVLGICAPGGGELPQKDTDELTSFLIEKGARGLVWFKIGQGKISSPVKKFFQADEMEGLKKKLSARAGSLILLVADKERRAAELLGELRCEVARRLNLASAAELQFVWVSDFPLFKYNEEEKRWETEHHPFTAPTEESCRLLDESPAKVVARSYDLVLNGVEMASGSIRIHRKDLQERIFRLIGINLPEAKERFGFLLKALTYGAPPHGGIAFGLDRLISIFKNTESIREVIAFPKTQKAVCPLTGAPSEVAEEQVRQLGLKKSEVRK